MKRNSYLLVGILVAALIFTSVAGFAAPWTGRLPWSEYQNLLRFQVAVPWRVVPEVEYVLQLTGPITEEQVLELEELGITLVAAVGDTIRVTGLATSFDVFGPGSTLLPWVCDVQLPLGLNAYVGPDFNWTGMVYLTRGAE